VAKFVNHHHHANKDDKSYCGNEKVMHKRENSDLTHGATRHRKTADSTNQRVSL
jgi:hypothetical protein